MATRSSLSSPESISCGMPASKTLPCSSRLSISSGANRAWKLVTPAWSNARAPTQAMSTLPALTSAMVAASYFGSCSARSSSTNVILSVPFDS